MDFTKTTSIPQFARRRLKDSLFINMNQRDTQYVFCETSRRFFL